MIRGATFSFSSIKFVKVSWRYCVFDLSEGVEFGGKYVYGIIYITRLATEMQGVSRFSSNGTIIVTMMPHDPQDSSEGKNRT